MRLTAMRFEFARRRVDRSKLKRKTDLSRQTILRDSSPLDSRPDRNSGSWPRFLILRVSTVLASCKGKHYLNLNITQQTRHYARWRSLITSSHMKWLSGTFSCITSTENERQSAVTIKDAVSSVSTKGSARISALDISPCCSSKAAANFVLTLVRPCGITYPFDLKSYTLPSFTVSSEGAAPPSLPPNSSAGNESNNSCGIPFIFSRSFFVFSLALSSSIFL